MRTHSGQGLYLETSAAESHSRLRRPRSTPAGPPVCWPSGAPNLALFPAFPQRRPSGPTRNDLAPYLKRFRRIPRAHNAACLENVLDAYARLHDPQRPGACLDQTSQPLVGELQRPSAPRPSQPQPIGPPQRSSLDL